MITFTDVIRGVTDRKNRLNKSIEYSCYETTPYIQTYF